MNEQKTLVYDGELTLDEARNKIRNKDGSKLTDAEFVELFQPFTKEASRP
jgi:hypothetical protein